jgi:hypothetical protein
MSEQATDRAFFKAAATAGLLSDPAMSTRKT